MDFENWCLEHKWLAEDYAPRVGEFLAWLDKPRPRGAGRYLDAEWAAMMRSELENSDSSWEQYCEWVRHGGGDEWFQEEAGFPKGTS